MLSQRPPMRVPVNLFAFSESVGRDEASWMSFSVYKISDFLEFDPFRPVKAHLILLVVHQSTFLQPHDRRVNNFRIFRKSLQLTEEVGEKSSSMLRWHGF